MLRLVLPNIADEKDYLDVLREWQSSGELLVPWVLQEDCSDFGAFVRRLNGYAQGLGVPEGFVPCTTLFAYDAGRFVGVVNIRHRLNDFLLHAGGHIGYGVRPAERKKGRATEMLRLTLEECARLGIQRALLCCDKENTASARVIRKNGGILENETAEGDKTVQRYWIDIP